MVDDSNKLINYKCNSCGKSFLTTNQNPITNCIFCGNTSLESKDSSIDNITEIISFSKTKDEAFKNYKNKISNPLIPITLKKSSIDDIKKMYLLVYLTDANVSGSINYLCADKKDNRKYSIIQNINFNYNDIVLINNSLIDYKEFIEICNYDFSNIESTNINYFNDSFYIEDDSLFDDSLNLEEERVRKNVIKNCKYNINHTLKKVDKDNTKVVFSDIRKVLVPIYMLNIKYKDNNYKYIYNGSTGSSYMNVSISKGKIVIYSILLFIIIFTLSFLLAYFL